MSDQILVLSDKYKEFIRHEAPVEFLEGTTAAGKTTEGIFKFMLKVAQSKKKLHIIAANDIGTTEKNIINKELGIIDDFGVLTEYKGNGSKDEKLSHILYHTPTGDKIIYVMGYSDKAKWKKALGGQYGCLYIDEINTADMEFVREASMRCDYFMGTLNPDDPNLAIFEEYINCARPLEKYKNDTPVEISEMMEKITPKPNWTYWFFSFKDNWGLPDKKVEQIKMNVPYGTKLWKNKIEGIRGKATGLVFNLESKHIITEMEAKKYNYVQYIIGCDTSYSKKTHDKLTFELIGLTNNGICVLLEEESRTNKDKEQPFAPSDVIPYLNAFAEKCKSKWGFARTIYIDSADAGTIAEAKKFKRETGCIYDFVGAWKQTKIVTRIQLQQSWMNTGHFLVVETCKGFISECNTYSYDDKGVPEDRNDHNINGCQYAWLPIKKKIGDWKKIMELIKDAYDD